MDKYDFYRGNSFDAYEYMGAHFENNGVVFRTFAPNAARISLIGEFNGWTETDMTRVDSNFFECFIDNAKEGMMYKYRIYHRDGKFIDHCDPYGFGMELRPKNASIIRDLKEYKFSDEKWLRKRNDRKDKPLNIYEIHLGSWRKKGDGETDWYTYSEIADQLISYVKENGYNYIEFMPLSEHPCDASWGYQNTGFFSPTSRYGTAKELMELVDKCHRNDIGVIMDFVPVHFAVDDYALAYYDGTPLYEYPSNDVGYSEWGSHNFIHSRGEIQSFLKSAANYWLTEYHFDGIRMDAIRNLIYWNGDEQRGVNSGGVEFLRSMNRGLKKTHRGIMLFAEDSTSFKGMTKPADEGGLGFDYKWDMGFMNDTLSFFQSDTEERKNRYHSLTFSMMYFYNEQHILPFSHDEVVHGKATIIQKMNGGYDMKFPQARALYMYMYAHPGKKLNFMGNEFAQFREWDEKREQDWDIMKYPIHDAFHRFMIELNKLYLSCPPLWNDFDTDGFRWLDCHEEEKCIYAFERRGGGRRIAAVFNFSDTEYIGFPLNIKTGNEIRLIISSNDERYGGAEYNKDCTKHDVINGISHITLEPFCGKLFDII